MKPNHHPLKESENRRPPPLIEEPALRPPPPYARHPLKALVCMVLIAAALSVLSLGVPGNPVPSPGDGTDVPHGPGSMEKPGARPAIADAAEGIDYVVWVDENGGSRGLRLDCNLSAPLKAADIASMARTIYGDIRGEGFCQVTIAWHVRNRAPHETPYAVSYMTTGKTAHRVLH